ncbi:MAG: ankyrin repeat domain-containing protein [Oscillatoria sp. PMC 1051.18]|nr:ankyrin repeat domain-containing protein [Oscillatoria sp. PMC 1050.18]MEC5032950.1 ankyrin repeat domain-containing protein [Oscillatoria sp. PMC 1051.18]
MIAFQELFDRVQDEYDSRGIFLEDGEEALLRAYAEAFSRLQKSEINFNLDESDEDGYTILMNLSLTGRIDLVRQLVEFGADVNALSNTGDYALALAARSGCQEIFDYLACFTSPELRKEAEKELPKGLIYRQRKNDKSLACLMNSATEGDLIKLEEIIQHGVDINAFCVHGNTALHKACRHQKLSAIKFLLQNGANPNIREEERGMTSLFYAIERKNLEIVQILIDNGANLNIKSYEGLTPLMMSVQQPSTLEIATTIIDANPNLNIKDNYGANALIHAAFRTDLMPIILAGFHALNIPLNELFITLAKIKSKYLQKILNQGIEWSEISSSQYELLKTNTPYLDSFDPKISAKLIVELLKRGAKAEDLGRVLLLHGVMIEDESRVRGLVSAGVDTKSFLGTTPLIKAVQRENLNIVEILLSADVDVNERDSEGNTALIEAARIADVDSSEMLKIVKSLLKAGADVNAKNKNGYRPLTYAWHIDRQTYNDVCTLGNPDIQRLLQNAGAIDEDEE